MIDNRGNLLTNCLCNSLWSLPSDIYVWLSAKGLMKRRVWTKGGHNSRHRSVSLTLIIRLYSSLLSSITQAAVKHQVHECSSRSNTRSGPGIKRSLMCSDELNLLVFHWCYEVNMQISSFWRTTGRLCSTVSDHLNVRIVSSCFYVQKSCGCGKKCGFRHKLVMKFDLITRSAYTNEAGCVYMHLMNAGWKMYVDRCI